MSLFVQDTAKFHYSHLQLQDVLLVVLQILQSKKHLSSWQYPQYCFVLILYFGTTHKVKVISRN